jgi:hypothetical protein
VQTLLPLNTDNVITNTELLNTHVQSRIIIMCVQGKFPSGKAMKLSKNSKLKLSSRSLTITFHYGTKKIAFILINLLINRLYSHT